MDRTGVDVDILKAKTREKLDGDQVKVKIIQALEHVPHMVDYEAFKTNMDKKLGEINLKNIETKFHELEANLANRCQDIEDTVVTLNANVQEAFDTTGDADNQLKDLKDKLMNFEVNIKESFESVSRVESNFHGHVAIASTELATETQALKQRVTAFSGAAGASAVGNGGASFAVLPAGATNAPAAGAHDGGCCNTTPPGREVTARLLQPWEDPQINAIASISTN